MKNLFVGLLLFVFCFPFIANAQHGMGKGHMQRIEKKIERRFLERLTDKLDLDEEKAIKLSIIHKKAREKRHEFRNKIFEATKKLRLLTNDSTSSAESIKKVVDILKNVHIKMSELEKDKMDKIEKLLQPRQFAQYILIESDFRRNIFRRIHKSFKNGGNH